MKKCNFGAISGLAGRFEVTGKEKRGDRSRRVGLEIAAV
jgi:hypothetical protein